MRAGRIPQQFIDEIVGRADILEVLGTRITLKKAGREYKGLCPFHGEKTPSFTVSPEKGFYHCFGCGAHGTAVGFLMEHDHLDFVEAIEMLAGMLGLDVPREGGGQRHQGLDQVTDLLRRTEQLYVDALKSHPRAIEYLRQRGIDGETAARFRIGYAPDAWDTVLTVFGSDAQTATYLQAAGLIIKRDDGKQYDRFRDRIMFPIRDGRGHTVGFGGRILGSGDPKYLNSPETVVFHKGRELYGLYESRRKLRTIARLLVVEGYMDVVSLARHGIEYAVATLGTATTPDHLRALFRVSDEVLFCFDGDRAGRQAAWRALENALSEARDGRQMGFVFLPDGEDPDTLVRGAGTVALESLMDTAMPLSEFLVTELLSQVDASSIDGRARLAELARPLLERVPAGVYQDLLLARLGDEIGISASKLSELLLKNKEDEKDSHVKARGGARRAGRAGAMRLSLIASVLRAVLRRPELGATVNLDRLTMLRRKGSDLLMELLEMTQENPNISPAVLLERFRGHPNAEYLSRLLASEEFGADDMDSRREFDDGVERLEKAAIADRCDELRSKLNAGEIDSDEKHELFDLWSQLKTPGKD